MTYEPKRGHPRRGNVGKDMVVKSGVGTAGTIAAANAMHPPGGLLAEVPGHPPLLKPDGNVIN